VTVRGVFLDKGSVLLGRTTVSPKAVTAMSNTAITFTAPPHLAGDVTVSVRNQGGTTLFGTLTYVAGNPPVITSLSASSASILWANEVTVTGTALTQVRKAVVAGKAVTMKKVSDTELVLKLPRVSAAVAGQVVLSSQWSSSASKPASAFSWVVPPKPAVTAVTGITANTVGTATLTGTGLHAATKVSLTGPGGKKYAGSRIVVVVGCGSLTATVPKLPAGSYTVTVTSVAGTSTAAALTVA
jgi:hypothetical protein